jgi:hypothetical protein
MNSRKIEVRERLELERANALARQLSALKARRMEFGAVREEDPQRLQKQHSVHLERCLRLRSLIGRLDVNAFCRNGTTMRTTLGCRGEYA